MGNLLGRGIEDERATEEDNDAVEIKRTLDPSTFGKSEKRILELLNQIDENEKQYDPKSHRYSYSELANATLVRLGRTLGFQGNVKEVVESQNRLQEDKKSQSDERVDQIRHGPMIIGDSWDR